MKGPQVEVSVKGRTVKVPSLAIWDKTVVVKGRWLKVARIRDEDWLEGEAVADPDLWVEKIRLSKLNADIFTFTQKLPNLAAKYDLSIEWDNVAAISTVDFSTWWEKKLPQVTRKNVRRAKKRGTLIREAKFNDRLLRGIVEINNETPMRQGKPFWHYGKSLEAVRRDYDTLQDRSEYIGAYYEDELIGFIKMVYMGEIAGILQLLCKNKYSGERPANALLARAVEICSTKGFKYLVYGKYLYGKNTRSPLMEFKRRNGFEQMLVPRYHIPLTAVGRKAIRLNLHLGFKHFLPEKAMNFMFLIRKKWYEKQFSSSIKSAQTRLNI